MEFPSLEQFEKGKSASQNITKWRDVPKGVIYCIEGVEYIETKYGNTLVTDLIDKEGNMFRAWVPGHITTKLKDYGDDGRTAYIKSLDLKSKFNDTSQKFWDYEIMWVDPM